MIRTTLSSKLCDIHRLDAISMQPNRVRRVNMPGLPGRIAFLSTCQRAKGIATHLPDPHVGPRQTKTRQRKYGLAEVCLVNQNRPNGDIDLDDFAPRRKSTAKTLLAA